MSLFDADIDTFEIDIYYKFISVGSGKKLTIVKDEEACRIIEENKKKEEEDKIVIEKLNTRWRFLTWKEQNDVTTQATNFSTNIKVGENQFNFLAYRDAIVKKCLKSWDIVVDNNPVPVTTENIDRLPGPIVLALYEKFEKIMGYSEEEEKN